MTQNILKPGDPFLYMKVGVHANESLEDILKRKRDELKAAGVSFWGYGGGSCHPFNAVQPFAKEVSNHGMTLRLFMQEIVSRHYEAEAATEYSVDGTNYQPVPKGVKVLGSKYALVLKSLDMVDFQIPLSHTLVGVGAKRGTSGDQYIRGRLDKACLVYTPGELQDKPIHMSLVAELAAPYAVKMR